MDDLGLLGQAKFRNRSDRRVVDYAINGRSRCCGRSWSKMRGTGQLATFV